jgi:hypothetical protein
MCECLLEGHDPAELEMCDLQLHTIYKLGLDAVDPEACTPRATAEAEVRARWHQEEI